MTSTLRSFRLALEQFNIFDPDLPASCEHQLDLDPVAHFRTAQIEGGLVPSPILRADHSVLQGFRKECALARNRAIHFKISLGGGGRGVAGRRGGGGGGEGAG